MEPLRLATVRSRALVGADAVPVAVEVHLGNGLPQFQMVGLPDTEVRESRERVRVALQASGYEFPLRRITVNLAPADLPKRSGQFDLPVALGLLLASGQLPGQRAADAEFAAELALDGGLRPVRGALALARAVAGGPRRLLLPADHAPELRAFAVPDVLVASSLKEVSRWLTGATDEAALLPAAATGAPASAVPADDRWWQGLPDLADVRGQHHARQALEVAAAGGHSLLLHGPPGCGKTLLAERLVGLLPDLDADEALECAIQRSLAGLPPDLPHRHARPCRRPHHTTPVCAITGGGQPLRPGELTLAHHGVLLLDELPEFPRACLESLREPLESGEIHLARVRASARLPARFQLVATMNPCPCGRAQTGANPCRCSPQRVRDYRARLSQPLLDRIDLWVPLQPLRPAAFAESPPEPTVVVRARVAATRNLQRARQGCLNARLAADTLQVQARLSAAGRRCWERLLRKYPLLSARGAHRLLAVARTLADLAQCVAVEETFLLQAAAWRREF